MSTNAHLPMDLLEGGPAQLGCVQWGVSNFYLFGFVAAIVLSVLTRNLMTAVFGSVGIVALLTALFGPR